LGPWDAQSKNFANSNSALAVTQRKPTQLLHNFELFHADSLQQAAT
jgi:hypothetical protein